LTQTEARRHQLRKKGIKVTPRRPDAPAPDAPAPAPDAPAPAPAPGGKRKRGDASKH